jgi:uncharacterized protein (DUF305 family)
MKQHVHDEQPSSKHSQHYKHLALMTLLAFATMYGLMYAMVNSMSNVHGNLNQFYMAGLMAAPMLIIELLVMRAMYRNTRMNAVLLGAGAILTVTFWFMIRQQTAINDRQFLRSMIPHHAGAILMCQQAPVADEEIKALCRSIVASQQSEIDLMKAKLAALDR